jgi:hypothetical protein
MHNTVMFFYWHVVGFLHVPVHLGAPCKWMIASATVRQRSTRQITIAHSSSACQVLHHRFSPSPLAQYITTLPGVAEGSPTPNVGYCFTPAAIEALQYSPLQVSHHPDHPGQDRCIAATTASSPGFPLRCFLGDSLLPLALFAACIHQVGQQHIASMRHVPHQQFPSLSKRRLSAAR